MTDVYLAIDTVENRKVALKVIRMNGDEASEQLVEAERRGAEIQREMQALDPRVVEIYDCGEADGYFFVAMQYVEGRNLAEVLRSEHVIDPIRAVTIAIEICEQLDKFHSWQSSVVHGDIKPSNIHLGHNDTVRLLDFGIAKTLRPDGDGTAHNFGSPGYCPPERLSRSRVDQQSDLWAVGATLYEMLSGIPPYQAESTRKLENLIRSKRAPRALPARCPRALRAVVSKALMPEPSKRYGSAREFLVDLHAFLERKPTVAEIERRPSWNPNTTIEIAREVLRIATRTLGQVKQRLQLVSAMGWFAAGLVLWIGGSYGWQALLARGAGPSNMRPPPEHDTPPVAPAAAAAPLSAPHDGLPQLYASAAERILSAYTNSSDPSLHDFDWQKAEVCLTRAVELGSGDDQTLGRLALSRGYATLERLDGGQYAPPAAAHLRVYARDQFSFAASKMPRDPAPHLALARIYVYWLPDVDRARTELASAQELGAALGRREIEQQADAYRLRALREEAVNLRLALQDAQAARVLYQRIPGFDRADQHLKDLAQIGRNPRDSRHKKTPSAFFMMRRPQWR
jgi:hypothetical protein